MTVLTRVLSLATLAGLLALLIGLIDAWAFGARFGLDWDKALVLAGLSWVAGVQIPTLKGQLRGGS
jgi:hypothetical protein